MMITLHRDISPILQHIDLTELMVFRVPVNGEENASAISNSEIVEYARETERYLGDSAHDFLIASAVPLHKAPMLNEATSGVLSGKIDWNFILVGYSDGGVIAVSHHPQPFQISAQTAEWWRP